MKQFLKDQLQVEIYDTRAQMGHAAGTLAAARIRECLRQKPEVNVIFAAAPSQNEMLDTLVQATDIEWNRVNAFHMDEYIGLSQNAPQGFGNFLKAHIFHKLPFKSVNYIDCEAVDMDAECARYTALLQENPVDIVLLGIGENGHLAFNDPPADFETERAYLVIDLDERCRRQQLGEGWFPTLDDVPKQAISMSVRQCMKARCIINSVPDKRKAEAVKMALEGPVTPMCAASMLQKHPDCHTFLDPDSASLLTKKF